MEVHAHPHTAPGGTGRKKWTHYVFEFLMLFLAVFSGFLAENQREHYVENTRAREYAKTLMEDLSADTLEILDVIREDKIVLSCFDSVCNAINNRFPGNKTEGSFYYYANIGTASPSIVWRDATITQITQSGNLRYFTNPHLVNKISTYYSNSGYITNMNIRDKVLREKSMDLRSQILNNHYFSRYSGYRILDWLNIPDSMMKVRLPLQRSDVDLLNEFANSFENRRANLMILLDRVYPNALKASRELISLLKKEYHL